MTMSGVRERVNFWYLDTTNDTVTATTATNLVINARDALAHAGATLETLVPLNRYSFLEELSDKLLRPMQLTKCLFGRTMAPI